MAKYCYSYIRFSSKKQELGQSRSRQKNLAVEWCAKNDGVLDTTLNMEDLGVSAFKRHNLEDTAALGGFLKALEEGRVPKGSYLLIENFDRLARAQTDEAYQLFRRILLLEIIIVTLQDGKIFTKESLNNFVDIILTIVTMSRAHEEIATKTRRLNDKWEERRRELDTTKIATQYPSWLRLRKDRSDFDQIEDRVNIIKQIFEDYANGIGVVTIARKLNEAGVPCFGNKRTTIWKTHRIQHILKQRALIGEYIPKKRDKSGNRVEVGIHKSNYFPRIIDEELWNKVQYRLGTNIRDTSPVHGYTPNMFAGKVFCAYCGEPMFVHYQKTKKTLKDGTKQEYGKRRTFTCLSAKNGKCMNISWPFEEFENDFLKCSVEVKAAIKSDENTKAKTIETIETIKTAIAVKERAINRYKQSFEKEDEPPDGALKHWKTLETEVVELIKSRGQAQAQLQTINNQNPYDEVDANVTLNEKTRALLGSAIGTTIERINVFFAGSKFQFALIHSEQKRLRKQGMHVTKVNYFLRKKYKIKYSRFFVVKLKYLGYEKRLVYPKHEASLPEIPDETEEDRQAIERYESEIMTGNINPLEEPLKMVNPTVQV